MKKVYPVIITPAIEGGFGVYIPDIQINTQGENIADAIDMARDAIGIWGIDRQDDGLEIIEPSTSEPKHKANELVTWVDIDFAQYRKANDLTTMRINLSIPKYLKVLSEKAGLNLSRELQEHLKNKLQIN